MGTDFLGSLHELRKAAGPACTRGLDDQTIKSFLASDTRLWRAIAAAVDERDQLATTHGDEDS